MCSRKDARKAHEAQDRAAEELAQACQLICSAEIGQALHGLYDTTLKETVPDDFKQLVDRLQ